jgi:tRNA1Val (adenine37-N6)-methyltransferase
LSVFHFKQFSVLQQKAAMKIGTDAVLLGAWCPIDNQPEQILDIGAGTGVLSLMLAQRTNAELIEALEIEENAYEECVENFENSPWSERLFCYHAGLDEFVDEVEELYELIICNPPFYTENYKTNNESRDLARFEDAMPFEELIQAADFFLTDEGVFCVIIPFTSEANFIEICSQSSLFPFKITHVKGNENAEVKRSLIAFSRTQKEPNIDELIIEIERHQYTEDYIKLTQDFYQKL